MKKLARISLLGDLSLLSKSELKQLLGASGNSDGCVAKGSQCTGGPCITGDEQGQSGNCGWNYGTNNCECLVGTFLK